MIKRSECRCICHADYVALGLIIGPMHVVACCEPDEPFKCHTPDKPTDQDYPIDQADEQY